MRYCHIHYGPYIDGKEDGCQHKTCVGLRELPDATMPLFATVPGGYNDSPEYRYHKNFERGLDEYRTARSHGLQPPTSNYGGVERMERQLESQQRGINKMKEDSDIEDVNVAPGVVK
jgi:hypothetical protein